ncbi:autotransporter domain-containing protein [Selenomonas sp. AE3005]|uniref:autotransporter domain-containing protein n=1 Tax=Selenomonas sp. AE3005 TaxID=1485543 RepID=UPI0025D7B9F7|nr:autotransporter domain-containing protein [Selenomonas sp. AE3005]
MKKKNLKPETKLARYIAAALLTSVCFGVNAPAYAADLPSFFDWRLTNPTDRNSEKDSLSIVPSVKNQGAVGTCWAFASLASYESSWMTQLKAAKAAGENVTVAMPDFSERYLAWMSFYPATSEKDTDTVPRFLVHPAKGSGYDTGGMPWQATLTMLNKGVVSEDSSRYGPVDEAGRIINRIANEDTEVEIEIKGWTDREKYKKAIANYTQTRKAELWREYGDREDYGAVVNTITSVGAIHDSYTILPNYKGRLSADALKQVKNFIQDKGVIMMANNSDGAKRFIDHGEWYYSGQFNHAQTLVGWDDDYHFKTKDENGNALQGGFIIRNNWDTNVGNEGYGYISYRDSSMGWFYFHEAELDSARYTINANNAPVPYYTLGQITDTGKTFTSQPIASSFQASQNHFLKGVMFYASTSNMKYDITVREGSKPGEGSVLYTQSGTFGADGTPAYAGYRTVDLQKYVLLPKDRNYVVEVTTTSTDGTGVSVALQPGSDFPDYHGYEGRGVSYVYDYEENTWMSKGRLARNGERSAAASLVTESSEEHGRGLDVTDNADADWENIDVFLVARGKKTDEAHGENFTVAYLDDRGSDNSSVINLGRASEAYCTDAAHPSRKTLANMTVDLDENVVNVYGGTITGEGKVIKTGEGALVLTGNNTHTGMTTVNAGTLAINGTLAGDVTTNGTGYLMGSGEIGGTLNNQAVAVAGFLGEGNLTVNNLKSEGGMLIANGNGSSNTKFIVNNTANLDNTMVLVANSLPEKTYEVLQAGSITGSIYNNSANPEAVSGMVSQSGEINGGVISVKTIMADNLGEASSAQRETMTAMNRMYHNLPEARREEMRRLYNLEPESAKEALTDIGSSRAGETLSIVQTNTLVSHVISDRLNTAFSMEPVNVRISGNNLADDGTDNGLDVPVNLPVATENGAWVKFTKNWGDLKSGANYHGSAISGGYDKAFGKNTRGGLFVAYNTMNLGTDTSASNIYDTRIGIYGGYHKGARDAYWYADYGWQRNSLRRGLSHLGLDAEADYRSYIAEIGGEYKYDLHAEDGKIWHVSPYVNMQLSYMRQNGYNEQGANSYNHQVSSQSNTYFAMGMGVEWKRYLGVGSYAMRLGVKHALSGADPKLKFNYEGDNGHSYTLNNSQDKTHVVWGISGETEFTKGWQAGGDVMLQKGAHDKDLTASIMLRRVW